MAEKALKISPTTRVDSPRAPSEIALGLQSALADLGKPGPIAALCIGSDRSTGDALGPFVGWMLEQQAPPNLKILGTLDDPVNAQTLNDHLEEIQSWQGPVIAIDACLSIAEHIGNIRVKKGPITPGAGVKTDLPPVGDIGILGIVNVGGWLEYFVLQNTRLSIVVKMASIIAEGLSMVARDLE